ncbi:MAG: leucine-rich repeat domain-containing protein, partial [Oscillospiraceae bacterium]|nr:leucine-rich repeat domain-containing protein [Oscillospiraceae bacterium]
RYAELPASVCDVGEFAFSCCDRLEKIVFTGKTLTLGDYALSDCENLKEVIFAEGTEKIELGWFAFENCENLQKLMLPSTLKEIKIDEEDFLEDCPDACAIVRSGSFAEDYCKKHKIEFQYPEEP